MTDKTAPIELIRKVAGALAFEELTAPATILSTEDIIRDEKFASVEDQELLKIAGKIFSVTHPDPQPTRDALESILSSYEALGGKYKHAFGTPMFNTQQMAGSPALAGGMQRRATTPMPAPQPAQPQRGPAAAPRAQQGQSALSAPTTQTASPATANVAPPTSAPAVSMG